jgi:hypothetical protein
LPSHCTEPGRLADPGADPDQYRLRHRPGDGFRITSNIQPVVPITVNDKWNVISRTILPVIYQSDVTGPG